jgi:tetratricopeptide (TPR) repeat protein
VENVTDTEPQPAPVAEPGDAAPTPGTAPSRAALEARRSRAIRDLVETQQQLEAGEIDEDTAARLTKIYEREVVDALEGLDSLGPEAEKPPSNRRTIAIGAVMVAACVVIAALATGALKPRKAGQAITGTAPASSTQTTRDLSTVSNDEMEKVIAQNPGITAMRLALAERYIADDQLDKALGHIRIALAGNPTTADRARALRDLGWATHLQGNSADGAKSLQQSLQLVPDDPNTQYWLAAVDMDGLHDPKAAITLLEQLVQSQQNDPEALQNVQARLNQAKAAAGVK